MVDSTPNTIAAEATAEKYGAWRNASNDQRLSASPTVKAAIPKKVVAIDGTKSREILRIERVIKATSPTATPIRIRSYNRYTF